MARTTDWLVKLRRAIERFQRVYRACVEKDESTISFIDVMDHFVAILCDNAKYLRRYATGMLKPVSSSHSY